MKKSDTMPLGIVVERRESKHPWQDFSWHVPATIPGGSNAEQWLELRRGPGWIQWNGGTLTLEIFRTDTEGYKQNLSLDPPVVFVVLREDEDDPEHRMRPVMATVCPNTAQDFMDSGDDIVETPPMPDPVIAWLTDFVADHHVERPFKKRRRTSTKNSGDAFSRPPLPQSNRSRRNLNE